MVSYIFRSMGEATVCITVQIVVLVIGTGKGIGIKAGKGGRGLLISDDLIHDKLGFGRSTGKNSTIGHFRFITSAFHFRIIQVRITGGILGRYKLLVTKKQEK